MVIGIVAGVTIPVLMNNSNGEEFKAAFKKAVLSLKQAVRLNYVAGGLSPLNYPDNTALINNLFKKRMNVLDVKSNPFKSSYTMTDCDFTNKGNPVCTEYTPDISNSIITQDGYIYYIVATKRADGAIPIIVDVNGQRRPNKATMNKNEPKDQYTVLLYDDIYLTVKPTRAPKEGCTEPSCYECNDPSCFCTDPSCYECTDPTCPTECTDPTCPTECSELSCLTQCSDPSCMQTPDPDCTDPSCTPDPGCTDPSCFTTPPGDTEPTPEPTEETEEPKCTPQSKPVNCIAGSYAADGCTYNCTKTCTNQSKPANCAYGHNNADCSYTCDKWNESKPSDCVYGYNKDNGSYVCQKWNDPKPDDCLDGYNNSSGAYVCTEWEEYDDYDVYYCDSSDNWVDCSPTVPCVEEKGVRSCCSYNWSRFFNSCMIDCDRTSDRLQEVVNTQVPRYCNGAHIVIDSSYSDGKPSSMDWPQLSAVNCFSYLGLYICPRHIVYDPD